MSLNPRDVRPSGTYTSKDDVKMTTDFNVNASDDRVRVLGITAGEIRDQGITEAVLQERMRKK